MTQHLRFTELGKAGKILAAKLRADDLRATSLTGGARREVDSAASLG